VRGRAQSLYSSKSSAGPISDLVAVCGRLPAWCALQAGNRRSHALGRIGMLQCVQYLRRLAQKMDLEFLSVCQRDVVCTSA
jgi:hypothetical protein